MFIDADMHLCVMLSEFPHTTSVTQAYESAF